MAIFIFFTFLIYIAKTVSEVKKKKTTKTAFIISLCSESLLHQKKNIMDPSPSYIFDSEIMYLPYFMGVENGGREEEMEGKER